MESVFVASDGKPAAKCGFFGNRLFDSPATSRRQGSQEVRQGERCQLDGFSKLHWMKADIHPEYTVANVHCSCGNQFYTRSTKSDLHVELCSACHPFYTGKQKLVDTGGRVERFQRRAAKRAKANAGQE